MNDNEALLETVTEEIRKKFGLTERAVTKPLFRKNSRLVRLVHKPTGKRIAIEISILVER